MTLFDIAKYKELYSLLHFFLSLYLVFYFYNHLVTYSLTLSSHSSPESMSAGQTSTAGKNPPLIVLNPDGSYTRLATFPLTEPTSDLDSDTRVLSKDLAINDVNKTWARIHIPKETLTATEPTVQKLPLVVYYHGGGFIIGSADSNIFHELCDQMASHLRVVVVNVDYRLAPEHRLPAAYEDGVEALYWIKSTNDPWLTNFVDFSNCFLMGISAGANLAYHVGLRVSKQLDDLEPLKIKGLILHSLFIGGEVPTESEIGLAEYDTRFAKSRFDLMWDLALPIDASRDHEYCNLMMGGSLDGMESFKEVGWRVMVIGRYEDLMIDRQKEFAKALELKGVECRCFYGDGYHGIECFDKSKANELLQELKSFMSWINDKKQEINVNCQ